MAVCYVLSSVIYTCGFIVLTIDVTLLIAMNALFINDLGNPVRNTIEDGGGYINEGVNPDGSVNTTRIRTDRYGAFGYARGLPNAAFVYDASYIKLRQVSLTYTMPSKFLDNTFMTGLQFSVTGSNLWIIDKDMPYADPESGL